MEIHQILPSLSYGDAISNHVLEIQRALQKENYHSDIFAQDIDPEMSKICAPYRNHKNNSSSDNILIFHYSIYSEILNYILSTRDIKIMIYHNVTPHHYFKRFPNHLFYLTKKGRTKLESFRDIPSLSLAVSEYNALELKNLGFKNVNVLPLIIDFKKLDDKPSRHILDMYKKKYTNIIFVGRISPNKKHEDLIKSFYFYKKYANPESRLFLVGSYAGMETYYDSLLKLAADLELNDVIFTGQVTNVELMAYYQLGDIFLCMSEHEGFCVPLVEAMHFKIPVIAYNATGVPYTLGKSGALLNEKNYVEIAELIHAIMNNDKMRETIIKSQSKQLEQYNKNVIESNLMKYIKETLIN